MGESPQSWDPARASDLELIEASRNSPTPLARACLETLYSRFYPRVAKWCLKVCWDRNEAADLAQEVFLRVHARLDTFRGESAFSTWLYTVMRSVAINRGLSATHRRATVPLEGAAESASGASDDAAMALERDEELRRLRDAMERKLEPLEARVLYLHYAEGLTLPAITRLLALTNKSGAKAYVVSGKRKLRRGLAAAENDERRELRAT